MKRGMKKAVIISLTATMAFATSNFAYANTQALPNGTIVNQNGIYYLTDSSGEKYSGWFIDSKEDWYYFNESDKSMKTGWHHDEKDGYWYYLSLSDGKMVTGWQMIDGKEYFFQPVRDRGNYVFNDEKEKWLYSINSKVPYGAMYANTTTPDGLKVDNQGVKIIDEKISTSNDIKTSDIVKNGWVSENGKWYYYSAGTVVKDQWLDLNGRWYYVTSDGTMVSNSWKVINGNSYYFGSDGAMYVNAVTPDGSRVDENGIKLAVSNKIDYSQYIGTFCTNEQYNHVMAHVSDFSSVEEAAINLDGRLSAGGGYFVITEINNDFITGTYSRHGSFDDSYSSFQKVTIDNEGKFHITVLFEEQGNSSAVVSGEREPITDSVNVECKLAMKNGNPIIIMNGQAANPVDYYNYGYDNFVLRKLTSIPLE